MMLYTIVNLESLLEGEVPVYNEFTRDGIVFQGFRESGELKLTRLISSNPYDYLLAKYQIGERVPLPFTK